MTRMVRVAFDIGGTFTDLVVDDGQSARRGKVLTTSDMPAEGALAGLDDLMTRVGLAWSDVTEVVHGTTLVSNAILERKFGATGLLTTAGFRDLLAMGRQQRYDAYDLRIDFPAPLAPRELRAEVDERTLASGQILRRTAASDVVGAVSPLVDAGARSIAICFLHAYRDPSNELAAKRAVEAAFPDLTVVASSQVAPEIREYERAVTAVATAAVVPLVDAYLDAITVGLARRGCPGSLRLMQSSGRTVPETSVRAAPITLLESGPAGGARAAAGHGDDHSVLGFDMGGTTAKACLINSDDALPLVGELEVARVHRFKAGSGLPIRTPSVDLVEIGAGGGSIAATDRLGLLRVGPESAGADPGPACYGFGGAYPTVTDANLRLGFLGAGSRLAGRLPLNTEAADKALAGLAEELGLSVPATALGIHRLVNEQMAAAARGHVIDRGGDPRRVTLVATGGAGPAHAVGVARLLGCPEVVVPVGAGTASAAGFLNAPTGVECSRSLPSTIDDTDWSEVALLYEQLEHDVANTLGLRTDDASLVFEHWVDARLVGQVHALTVPLTRLDASISDDVRATYRERFRVNPGELPLEVLTWRCHGSTAAPPVSTAEPSSGANQQTETLRSVIFDSHDPVECRVMPRSALAPDTRWTGPLVVEEPETTTVVPPGDRLEVATDGGLRITLGEQLQ